MAEMQKKKITQEMILAQQAALDERLSMDKGDPIIFGSPKPAQIASLQEVIQRASVRVAFEPDEIISQLGNKATTDLTDSLAENCIQIKTATGEAKWQIREGVRRNTLRNLLQNNQVQQYLLPSDSTISTEQKVFQDWLVGQNVTVGEMSRDELTETLRVHDTLNGLVKMPTQAELASHLERMDLIDILKGLSGGHFAGRTEEMDLLHEFVWDRPDSSLLLIHGPGGMGKSTLLGEFLLRNVIKDNEPACPFAYLDFDRRSISIEYPVTLLYEALWQLAAFYPQHREPIIQLRERWRPEIASIQTSMMDSALETIAFSTARQTSLFISDFQNLLSDLKLDNQPFLLVLDTFEEVQARSNDFVGELFHFLENLRQAMSPADGQNSTLRVVLSGRVPVPQLPVDECRLEELDKEASQQFLCALDIAPNLAARIVEQIRGIPLTLRLAANLVKKNQSDLLSQGELNALNPVWYKLQEEQLQGLIYERYLQQIHDADIRKLAYPGLILRRITPEIIEQVLAEPCDLQITQAPGEDIPGQPRTKEALFNALACEVSLVSYGDKDELRHRPELRAVMIEFLKRDQKEKVRQIHSNAVAYYEPKDDLRSRAEEIYHRLMLEQSHETISQRWEPGVESYLNDCRSELPKPSQLILAARIGTDTLLEGDDQWRQTADQESWERYAKRRVERLIKLNEPRKALEILRERTERLPGSSLFDLEISVCKHLSDWQGMRETALRGISSAADIGDGSLSYKLSRSLVHALLLLGDYEEGRRILNQARQLIPKNEGIPSLAYHLELNLAEIELIEADIRNHAEDLPQGTTALEQAFELEGHLFNRAVHELTLLLERSRVSRRGKLLRRAAGTLYLAEPQLVSEVIRRCGVTDGDLNLPQRRLLCRACVTWDEIVSANRRQPSGLLAQEAGIRNLNQPLESDWYQATEQLQPPLNWIIDVLMQRFGLPNNAIRRFAEFFRLPEDVELFAPLHTKILDSMDWKQLEDLSLRAFQKSLYEITIGKDRREIVRQLLTWSYEEGRFQELLDATQAVPTSAQNRPEEIHLDPSQRNKLLEILVDDLGSLPRLIRFMRERLDRSLEFSSSVIGSAGAILSDAIRDFNKRGEIGMFIDAACVAMPENKRLRRFAQSVGISEVGQIYRQSAAKQTDTVDPSSLPATYMDSESWRARYEAFNATICRVEVGEKDISAMGTGFLVGPDLVLTCRTVWLSGIRNSQKAGRAVFGYSEADSGAVKYELAEDPVAAIGNTEELDYILLRTQHEAGSDSIKSASGTTRRGWIDLKVNRSPVTGEGSYVWHHPQGGPLQFSFTENSIQWLKEPNVYYLCPTAPGSMGAPVITTDWHLVAMHKGKDPADICFGLLIEAILLDLEQQGLSHLIST